MKPYISAGALLLAGMLCCTGCGAKKKAESEPAGTSWEPTAYKADDLPELMPENYTLPHTPDADDTSDEALRAYNLLLGYLENELHIEYQLCDYYYVDFDEIPHCYVIKVVPDGEPPEFTKDVQAVPENAVMLSVYPDGSHAESGVVPHLMARKWTEDLRAELAKSHPDWHMNTWYLVLDHIVPPIAGYEYADIRDYHELLDGKLAAAGNTDMCINLLLPPGTPESDADAVFAELEPLLKQYGVTEIRLVTPKDDAAMQQYLAAEKQTGNQYGYMREPNAWTKSCSVK
ncbi:MAG: hypothetical protein IKQ39_03945 [Oscillospiraceae bacterium]|nr:hypothetical protein [Oscillospiraceae bacterium]